MNSKESDSSTFRVGIDSVDREKFLNEDVWARGIVIRPWKFKPKTDAEIGGGAVESAAIESTTQAGHQSTESLMECPVDAGANASHSNNG